MKSQTKFVDKSSNSNELVIWWWPWAVLLVSFICWCYQWVVKNQHSLRGVGKEENSDSLSYLGYAGRVESLTKYGFFCDGLQPEVNFLHSWAVVFPIFGHIVPIRVNTLVNTILVGLRYTKKGKWCHFRLPSEAQKHLCLNSLITVTGIQ